MVYLTRIEHFNAAHKLYNPNWSKEKNDEIFGKCANENFHGHNFELYVTIKGEPDPDTGFIYDAKKLGAMVNEKVIDKLDHRNLNTDVDFMQGKLCSIENLVMEIWKELANNIQHTKPLEWISTITQIASVWYARKNNVLVYPTGIIGVLLAAYLYFFDSNPPLYADGSLNIYYFLMSVYGWYNWVKKKDAELFTYPISWCTKQQLIFGIGFFLFFWAVIYYVLSNFTDSNTPQLDSLVSASAITAMWWMAKRKIENWLAWIFSNIVAIPLNFYKHYYLFTLMYILFLAMAWWGYMEWKRQAAKK